MTKRVELASPEDLSSSMDDHSLSRSAASMTTEDVEMFRITLRSSIMHKMESARSPDLAAKAVCEENSNAGDGFDSMLEGVLTYPGVSSKLPTLPRSQ